MQKTKIITISLVTTLIVGAINTTSALIAYSLLRPDNSSTHETLITSEDQVITALPQPDQPSSSPTSSSPSSNVSTPTVQIRRTSDKLVAGAQPRPASVVTQPDGKKVYKWCSGTNPNLPDEVCQAIISIVASPSASNPHLSEKAKESLSLLPKDSSLTMDENSWSSTNATSGTLLVTAHTSAYGDIKLRITLELQNNIWVVTDGQLA